MLKTQKQQQEWLREVLLKTGKSPSRLAQDARLTPSTLTRFLKAEDGQMLSANTIFKIERVLEYAGGSPSDSTQGLTEMPALSTVDVLGSVEAGAWRDVGTVQKKLFSVAIPPNVAAGAQKYGLEVRGQSMNKVYPHGTVVICVSAIEAGREPEEGERVIVERTQNGFVEATVKEYRDGKLWPNSDDPDHQQPLEITPLSELGDEEVRITGYVVGSYRPE